MLSTENKGPVTVFDHRCRCILDEVKGPEEVALGKLEVTGVGEIDIVEVEVEVRTVCFQGP